MSSPASGPRRADVLTPTPRRLYIHDDLSEELRPHGEGAPAWPLWRAPCALLGREPGGGGVLPPGAPIAPPIARRAHAPLRATAGPRAARAPVAPRGRRRPGGGSRARRGGG